MSDLHTITVEILRPGPSHNQLLSPLTSYIALCDNRGAVTLNLPFEHREMVRQREALSYALPRAQREAQLQQTGDAIGYQVIGAISTLSAALAQTPCGKNTLIHLRVILSAAELAMLPFEVATAPQGFPGEAKPMLIQCIAPITLTREVRGATLNRGGWSRPARILVIAASPPGFEPVPLRAHLLALRRAVDNWVPTERAGGVRALITVLPQASVQAIREACARYDYTHIHILAHGTQSNDGGEPHFGLALIDERSDAPDIVGGNRLASVLRTHRKGEGGFSSPNFVTLCTCDSSNVGSVVFPGASMAHDLHEAGIPWVVASQFPLSMVGSTVLCDLLYEGLLRGDDPRTVLHHLRLCLRAECPATHDWGSVVAYAAIPPDFDEQVREARQQQSERAINVAFSRVDELMDQRRNDPQSTESIHDGVGEILRHLDEQLEILRRSVPEGDEPGLRGLRVSINSRQGSVEKRRAYVFYEQDRHGDEDRPKTRDEKGRPRPWAAALRRAKRYYFAAAKLELNMHWPLTQYLALLAIMGEPAPRDYFTVARVAAELDLDSANEQTRAWANASLSELHLLELLWEESADAQHAVRHAQDLLRIAGVDSFPVESTRRQFERYLTWGEPCQTPRFVECVKQLMEILAPDC